MWRRLTGFRGLRVAEGAAVVVKKSAEGELVEGVLWVFPLRGAKHVQSPGAVPTVAPRSGATFLLHGVKVGRVHWMGDLGAVGGWLLPQIAGEVNLGEEGVGFYLASPVGTQTIFCRAAEAADDVDGLWTKFDLGGHLQGTLPINDLKRNTSLRVLHREVPSTSQSKFNPSLCSFLNIFTVMSEPERSDILLPVPLTCGISNYLHI